MKLADILDKILKHYGTLDQMQVWSEAASQRAGTNHSETTVGDRSYCGVCGACDNQGIDPIFHPEAFLTESAVQMKLLAVGEDGTQAELGQAWFLESTSLAEVMSELIDRFWDARLDMASCSAAAVRVN